MALCAFQKALTKRESLVRERAAHTQSQTTRLGMMLFGRPFSIREAGRNRSDSPSTARQAISLLLLLAQISSTIPLLSAIAHWHLLLRLLLLSFLLLLLLLRLEATASLPLCKRRHCRRCQPNRRRGEKGEPFKKVFRASEASMWRGGRCCCCCCVAVAAAAAAAAAYDTEESEEGPLFPSLSVLRFSS